jgi:hypothetical protein
MNATHLRDTFMPREGVEMTGYHPHEPKPQGVDWRAFRDVNRAKPHLMMILDGYLAHRGLGQQRLIMGKGSFLLAEAITRKSDSNLTQKRVTIIQPKLDAEAPRFELIE